MKDWFLGGEGGELVIDGLIEFGRATATILWLCSRCTMFLFSDRRTHENLMMYAIGTAKVPIRRQDAQKE